jgi:hypothetical protein
MLLVSVCLGDLERSRLDHVGGAILGLYVEI